MGWATKTNCETPLPTLGNPRSLVPKIERTSAAAELALLSLGNYLASPARHSQPTAPSSVDLPSPCGRGVGGEGYPPYTDAITLTDADDLADFLPSTPTATPDTAPTSCHPSAGLASTNELVDAAAPIPNAANLADSTLPLPRLSPARTLFSNPVTSVLGDASSAELGTTNKMIPFTQNGIIFGIISRSDHPSDDPNAQPSHIAPRLAGEGLGVRASPHLALSTQHLALPSTLALPCGASSPPRMSASTHP